ncbi:TetR/AcrR family transcriptional regulator [Streptomyces hygroscopicus]|uniref:TetR/AcrR family transcriptional regulator n=1 Tax=Streptomyces hygroscopicus TaxID=1912 RepID=UPI0008270A94|nr:TetR/AcrR family transcriptional regulator [Streptomyces hygroscopicus]
MDTPAEVPESRGAPHRPRRPRSARAHDAVLTATSALMREDGVAAVTIDRVAGRSGVSTATIYKHWPCKAAIMAEAFGRDTAEAVAFPDTGRPIDDLVTFATDLLTYYTSPDGALFGQLLAACATEPQAAPYFHEFFLTPRRAALEPYWERAAAAGLTRPGVDASTATDVLLGALTFRLMARHESLAPEEVRKLVEYALHGLLLPTADAADTP